MTAQMFFSNPIVIGAILALLVILAFVFLRPRQRVRLSEDDRPVRPHMHFSNEAEGRGLAGEAAAGTADVAGDILRAPVHEKLANPDGRNDDLLMLKGIGPKLAATLRTIGITSFAQIASLSDDEVDRLDSQLGAFAGRLKRDRVVEQADYLARGDTDGFEQRFGKL